MVTHEEIEQAVARWCAAHGPVPVLPPQLTKHDRRVMTGSLRWTGCTAVANENGSEVPLIVIRAR